MRLNKKMLILSTVLLLAACDGDRKRIIADVCAPLSSGTNADVEKRAIAKGYDLDRVRSVCHDYVVQQQADFAKEMRKLGIDKPGPYDAR